MQRQRHSSARNLTSNAASTASLDLYRAVARRDAAEMSAGARRLLANDAKSPAILDDYLVTAAMLGDIAAGNSERALVA